MSRAAITASSRVRGDIIVSGPQILRPISDIEIYPGEIGPDAYAWVKQPGLLHTDLYQAINEEVNSTTNYVHCLSGIENNTLYTFGLSPAVIPSVGERKIEFNYKADLGSQGYPVYIDLLDGSDNIIHHFESVLPENWTKEDIIITESISDYSNLRIRILLPFGGEVLISQVQMIIPSV